MRSILFKNAYIITIDERRTIYKNGSVYIEDNKIVELGEAKDVDYKADLIINAKNKILLPGFVNTHHHLYQTMNRCVPLAQDLSLFDWLKIFYSLWEEYTSEEVYVSAQAGIIELLLSGCTTTSDLFYIFPKNSKNPLDETVRAARELGIRFYPCRGSMSLGKSKGGLPPDDIVQSETEIIKDSIRVINKYHDPSRHSMCKVALAPCSPFSVTEELLVETRKIAKKYNIYCHTHLAETSEEEKFCLKKYGKRPLAWLEELDWLGKDVWLAHGVHFNKNEIEKLAKTATGISYCPTSNMRMGSGIAPIAEMLKKGVNVSIGVDGSASNDSSNFLQEIRNAMLLQRVRYGANALSAAQTLELATLGGARVLGIDRVGSIKKGYSADLICIDLKKIGYAGAHDPIAALVFCQPTNVEISIINGKLIVSDGKVLGIDVEEIIEKQNKLAKELVKRASRKTGVDYLKKE